MTTARRKTRPGIVADLVRRPQVSWNCLRVWQRDRDAYMKYYKLSLLGSLGDPLLYLFAMGYGLGRFLEQMEGMSYMAFIAPGLVISSAMFSASFECTYSAFLRMIYMKTYDAILATPLTIEDVVAGDILDYAEFFVPDDAVTYDAKAFDKRLRNAPGAVDLLARFAASLAGTPNWDAQALEACLKEFVAAEEIKIGGIIHAVRVALTGKGVGFGLYDAMAILGEKSCLARMQRAVHEARQENP